MTEGFTADSGALIFATLADVYLSSGMVDEAISILKDGLIRNPSYTLAKIILGRAYYMKGAVKEALKILETVYEEVQDSENLNLYLGLCYKKINEREKAIKFFDDTLKINPANIEAKRELDGLRPVSKPTPPVEAVAVPIQPPVAIPIEVKPAIAVSEVPRQESPAKITPISPLDALSEPVNELLSIKTVKGALISSRDGLLIQSYYPDRADLEEICALIAEIYNDADSAFNALHEDGLERFIIEKDDETISVIGAGDALFTVITRRESMPGIVFVYARKIIDEIKAVLG
jgi:predicted regulator of Ras-like GTPase activity (Roadblock/LC7/MglB family)